MMGRFKHLKLSICLALLVLSLGFVIFAKPHKALADTNVTLPSAPPGGLNDATFKWVDSSNITGTFANGAVVDFRDTNGMIDFWAHQVGAYDSIGGTCSGNTSTINATSNGASSPNGGRLNPIWYSPSQAAAGSCLNGSANIPIASSGNSKILYNFQGTSLVRVDGDPGFIFNQSSKFPTVYLKANGTSQCPDEIVDNGNGTATLYELTTGSGGNLPASAHAPTCVISGNLDDVLTNQGFSGYQGAGSVTKNSNGSVTIHVGGTPGSTTPGTPGGTSGTGGAGGPATPTCEASGGPLSWVFCAFIGYVGDAEQNIEKVVDSLLQTKTQTLDSSDPIYNVWSTFRLYGNIVLVIALLVVVFTEAGGGGLIDAYTAKKMLPRIVVAAILINLSIYIVAGLEDVFNILGRGLNDLISTPFKSVHLANGQSAWQLQVGGVAGTGGFILGGGATAALLLDIASGAQFAAFLALMVGLPMLLAALGVLVTLMLRIGIIAFLIISAPVAFALYALPNTEQYFRKWWGLLLKTLAVFPIVSLVFAMANITSVLLSGPLSTATNNSIPQWLSQAMGIAALIAPLFLIPFAFKIAGGALGAIHEGVTRFGQRAKGAIQGDVKNPASLQNRVRSRFNQKRSQYGISNAQIGETLGGFLPGRRNIYTSRGRRQLGNALSRRKETELGAAGQQYLESDDIWQQYKEDSKFTMAVGNRELAQRRRDQAAAAGKYDEVRQWQQALDNASLIHSSPATRMAGAQAWLASGFDLNENGQQAYNEMAETFADITGAGISKDGRGNVTGFTGAHASAAVNAMNTAQAAMVRNGQFHLAGINYGTGYDPDMGLGKADPFSWGRGKPGSSIGARDSALEHIRLGTPDDLKKASVYKQELRSIAQSSTGSQRDEALRAFERLNDTSTPEGAALDAWEKTATGNTVRAERLDRAGLAAQASASIAADPVANAGRTWDQEAIAQGWTPAEIAQGYRDRLETNKDIADREARTTRIPREDE